MKSGRWLRGRHPGRDDLHEVRKFIFDLRLGNIVVIDMGLHSFRVYVVADVHDRDGAECRLTSGMSCRLHPIVRRQCDNAQEPVFMAHAQSILCHCRYGPDILAMTS